MRLWHDSLIPILDRQRLLGLHREICALRGKGWGRKHSIVNYVFKHNYLTLYNYHEIVIKEMQRRKYNVDQEWLKEYYRGKKLEYDLNFPNIFKKSYITYPEHNNEYLKECQKLLLERNFDYYSKYFL